MTELMKLLRVGFVVILWLDGISGSTDTRYCACTLMSLPNEYSMQPGSGDFYLTSRLCSSPDFFKKLGVI